MKYSSEELNEIFINLPEEVQDAVASVDTAKIINETGKKYGLHIDQIGQLAEETGLVLMGLTHPTEFVGNLTKRLGIERMIVSQIASDLNNNIFLKVRDMLKDIQKSAKEDEESEPNITDRSQPVRDALLEAIQNPEGINKKPEPTKTEIPLVAIKNPYEPAKPEMGKDFPVVAPVPAPSILEQKMSGQFSIPKTESTVTQNQNTPGKKVDPYKEQI